MNAIGAPAQVPRNQRVDDILQIPDETACQKIRRIALAIISVFCALETFLIAGLIIGGVLPGWHLVTAVGFALAAITIARWHRAAKLMNPEERSEVIAEAKKKSFKELLELYSLKQMIDYQILPRVELRVKALRYLEESALKDEHISMELLDSLVEEGFISNAIRTICNANVYPEESKLGLFALRFVAEADSPLFARAQEFFHLEGFDRHQAR